MLPEASVVFSFSSDGLSWSLLGCSSSEHGTNLDSWSSCCTERLKLRRPAVGDPVNRLRDAIVLGTGNTLVFEPLHPAVDSIFTGRWSLTTLIEPGGTGPGFRVTDVIPETEVTIEFSETGVSGSAGCNSYGAPLSVKDSTIAVGAPLAGRMLWLAAMC